MAQEKDERPVAAVKRTSETGEDSLRRNTGTQSRSTAREPGNGGDSMVAVSPPGRRRERYIIGMRTGPGGHAMAQHSMDEVVQYLNGQENVEVVKRIKIGRAHV